MFSIQWTGCLAITANTCSLRRIFKMKKINKSLKAKGRMFEGSLTPSAKDLFTPVGCVVVSDTSKRDKLICWDNLTQQQQRSEPRVTDEAGHMLTETVEKSKVNSTDFDLTTRVKPDLSPAVENQVKPL